jgi:hypothetical protein
MTRINAAAEEAHEFSRLAVEAVRPARRRPLAFVLA